MVVKCGVGSTYLAKGSVAFHVHNSTPHAPPYRGPRLPSRLRPRRRVRPPKGRLGPPQREERTAEPGSRQQRVPGD